MWRSSIVFNGLGQKGGGATFFVFSGREGVVWPVLGSLETPLRASGAVFKGWRAFGMIGSPGGFLAFTLKVCAERRKLYANGCGIFLLAASFQPSAFSSQLFRRAHVGCRVASGLATNQPESGLKGTFLFSVVCSERYIISTAVSNAIAPNLSAAEHHQAGINFAAQRRFREAVREYLEAARLNPNFPETFYNLGVAYGELSEWKAAIKAYKRAIQLDPRDWKAQCNLGVDYVNSRQYTKAICAFRCAVELNPLDMTLFVSIGYNSGRLKRYSEAIEAYSHALELKPDFAVGWYNIGLFQFHLRHFGEAILAAERALAIDPDYAPPYVVIGMARKESGDLDGALTAFRRAAEINPHFMEAHANLGETYLRCSQIEAASRQLQWALGLHPKEPWLYRTMALAHWKQRKIIAALGDLSRAAYLYLRRGLSSAT